MAGFVGLTDRVARERIEAELGLFVVEGALALQQLIESVYPVHSVLVATNRLAQVERLAPAPDRGGAPLYVAVPEVLVAIAGFNVHRGILALGVRRALPDPESVLAAAAANGRRCVVVLDGVNDHENLGAIFRNAAAFGAAAVLADPTTCDPLYRRSIRVSSGHVLRVPFARLELLPGGLEILRRTGWTVVALTPTARAETIDQLAGDPPDRVALVVGAEGPGLRPEILGAADRRVRIPMAGGVDSLNVATAAAIALHRLCGPRYVG